MVRKLKKPLEWHAKEWLTYKKLKQTDVVAKTTYNKGLVSAYVNGRRRWNRDVLEQFAKAIGVAPGDLLRLPEQVEDDVFNYLKRMSRAARDRLVKSVNDSDAKGGDSAA